MTDPLTPAPLSEAERAGPEGRWRTYDCEELIYRDKASLDIFWLKDESLEDSENLPEPGLERFREIVEDLGEPEETGA